MFAASIADKLTAAELKSIIGLTTKLRGRERELFRARAEREDLGVRLEGATSVKEFLTKKLKEMEEEAKRAKIERGRGTAQTRSDQEVIGFLDARVRELEKQNAILEEKAGKALKDAERTKEEKVRTKWGSEEGAEGGRRIAPPPPTPPDQL